MPDNRSTVDRVTWQHLFAHLKGNKQTYEAGPDETERLVADEDTNQRGNKRDDRLENGIAANPQIENN